MRPRIPPKSSISFSGGWPPARATSFWWGTRTRAFTASGRPGPRRFWSSTRSFPTPGSSFWRKTSAPLRPSSRPPGPSSAAIGPAGTSICSPATPTAPPIRHTVLQDGRNQYRYLLQIARDCREETAVLYRNHYSAVPLIDLLEREGIPYRCRAGEGSFFGHFLVRDILDILRFAFRPTDGDAFWRFYYKLGCGLKKDQVAAVLRRQAGQPDAPVLSLLLEAPGLEPWVVGKVKALKTHLTHLLQEESFLAVNRIVRYMGYGDYLKNGGADTGRLGPLLALANQNPGPWEQFLHRMGGAGGRVVARGSGGPGCPLCPLHHPRQQGSGVRPVILIDVLDGIFPSVPEPRDGQRLSPEEESVLEEERRLFYVAVTRARQIAGDSYLPQGLWTERPAGVLVCLRPPPPPPHPPPEAGPPAPPAGRRTTAPACGVAHRHFGPGDRPAAAGPACSAGPGRRGTAEVRISRPVWTRGFSPSRGRKPPPERKCHPNNPNALTNLAVLGIISGRIAVGNRRKGPRRNRFSSHSPAHFRPAGAIPSIS